MMLKLTEHVELPFSFCISKNPGEILIKGKGKDETEAQGSRP